MISPSHLILYAFILDLCIGDPRRWVHPVTLIAKLAKILERLTRSRLSPSPAGFMTVLLTCLITALITWAIIWTASYIHPIAGTIVSIYILFTGFATHGLISHGYAVWRTLKQNHITKARQKAGLMVGRDTNKLDSSQLTRATVESLGENLIDGVTAPLFFAACFGPIGLMTFKAISTMDSLFGYRNERYLYFGKTPARIDDIAVFIPARLTVLLMPLAALLTRLSFRNAIRIIWRDRLNHQSPNAGHGEAAVAGALRVQLGGTNTYQGVISQKPHIGDPITPLHPTHIPKALRLVFITSVLFLCITLWIS